VSLAGMNLARYGIALAITLLVEVPLVAAFYPGRRRAMALTCAVASTATHLLLHFVFPAVLPRGISPLLAGEAFATLAEAGAYAAVAGPPRRAMVASAVANSCSYGAGLLLFG
jgi:hypothetical protein